MYYTFAHERTPIPAMFTTLSAHPNARMLYNAQSVHMV